MATTFVFKSFFLFAFLALLNPNFVNTAYHARDDIRHLGKARTVSWEVMIMEQQEDSQTRKDWLRGLSLNKPAPKPERYGMW